MKKQNIKKYQSEFELFDRKLKCIFSQEFAFFDTYKSSEVVQNNKKWIDEIKLTSTFQETYFIVIEEKNAPILFSSFHVVKLNAKNLSKNEQSSVTNIVSSLFFMLNKPNLLILGNIFRTESPQFICSNEHHTIAFEIVLKASVLFSKKINPTLLVLKEIPKNEHTFFAIKNNDFSSKIADPTMELNILPEWQTLFDYEQAITRKYAARMQKILAQRENFDCIELNFEQIIELTSETHALYKSTLQDQEIVLNEVNPNYWAGLKNIHQHDFKLFGIFIKSKLVAFYTTFEDAESLELYYVGFDNLANQKHQLYFNILFYGIEMAISSHKKTLKLGRTAWDAKYSLGAVAKPNEIHLKAICLKGKMLDGIISCSKHLAKPQIINRNPFRKNTTLQYSDI
ncbi:MAG: hypothetical protein EAZ53_09775 [Bacteroidetes bacterium]|nr:MAG: hypothetical protein EAZ53_09775 [Bacteroidota bacterium]